MCPAQTWPRQRCILSFDHSLLIAPAIRFGSSGRRLASENTSVERTFSDIIDVIILPLRHTIYTINLWALRFAFPGSWDADEFWTGAPQAFRLVTQHMELE